LVVSSLSGPVPWSALIAGIVPASVTVGYLVGLTDPQRLAGLFIGATYVFTAALFLVICIDSWR